MNQQTIEYYVSLAYTRGIGPVVRWLCGLITDMEERVKALEERE